MGRICKHGINQIMLKLEVFQKELKEISMIWTLMVGLITDKLKQVQNLVEQINQNIED